MTPLKTLIIGCGKGGDGSAGSHSIGYAHADAYVAHGGFSVHAACDLDDDNLLRFKNFYGLQHASKDLDSLLLEAKPDVVSICTYAASHREIFEKCVAAGVRAIWCEKPLVLSMDDGLAMMELSERHNVKVVVNHYRRYLHLFTEARRLLSEKAIGTPILMSSSLGGWDQMEWGTHWLDMMRFWAGDQPVKWVMGQVRCSGEKSGYGHLMEEHSINYFSFEDGTRGVLDGGLVFPGNSALRVEGTDGSLEATWDGRLLLANADGRSEIPVKSNVHVPTTDLEKPHVLLLADWLEWMNGGAEPQVSMRNALLSSELYLACYESAAIGNRIDLPLRGQASFPLKAIAARQSNSSNNPK
jgi:predicted dehydrogenase